MKKFAQSRPRRLLTDAGVRRDRLAWRYCETALRMRDRFFGAVAAGAGVAPIDRPRPHLPLHKPSEEAGVPRACGSYRRCVNAQVHFSAQLRGRQYHEGTEGIRARCVRLMAVAVHELLSHQGEQPAGRSPTCPVAEGRLLFSRRCPAVRPTSAGATSHGALSALRHRGHVRRRRLQTRPQRLRALLRHRP